MSRTAAVRAQARVEAVLTVRRGESVLLIIGIPLLLLVFFSQVDVLPLGDAGTEPIQVLAPGILALAVMSTAMVALGIATGFERSYGVLKRLGTTPLGRDGLLVGKVTAVAGVLVVQLAVLVAVSLALGWSPSLALGGALAGVVLGTAAFAGIGMAMAGRLRAEANLAAANGLYLVLLLLGGMVVPLDELPTPLRILGELLPSGALTEVLRGTLGDGPGAGAGSWAVLVVWAVVAPAVAVASFRWE